MDMERSIFVGEWKSEAASFATANLSFLNDKLPPFSLGDSKALSFLNDDSSDLQGATVLPDPTLLCPAN